MSKAILYDATQCIGCLQCEEACAKENGLPYDEGVKNEKRTSDHKYTFVAVKKVAGEEKYMRRLCMHCDDPTCVSVCPVGALEKTKLGPVTYDADKCMGCRYCMVACPFGVPKYEWTKAIPRVRKCIMCSERVAAGKQTACAEVCPTGATIFGERDALLAEARRRLRENPAAYLNHIYGEKEVGGTSTLLLSSVAFGDYGYPTHYGPEPLPPLTGKVLEHVPDVVVVGAALLGGIYWISNRREIVASAEKNNEENE